MHPPQLTDGQITALKLLGYQVERTLTSKQYFIWHGTDLIAYTSGMLDSWALGVDSPQHPKALKIIGIDANDLA